MSRPWYEPDKYLKKSETEKLPLERTFLVPLTAAEDCCIHEHALVNCDELTSEIDRLKIFWNIGWTKSGESWYNFFSECNVRKECICLLWNTKILHQKYPLAFQVRRNTKLKLLYSLLIPKKATVMSVHWKRLVFRHWRLVVKGQKLWLSVCRERKHFPVTRISDRWIFKVCSQPGENLKDKAKTSLVFSS